MNKTDGNVTLFYMCDEDISIGILRPLRLSQNDITILLQFQNIPRLTRTVNLNHYQRQFKMPY